MDAHTPTLVSPFPMTAPTMTPSTIATITTTSQAPILPTIALSTIIQDLPNFGSLFGFDNRLRTLEANFSEFMQTNQFAGAISAIPGIVQRYMDQRLNEAVKVKIKGNKSIQRSDKQRNLYKALVEAYESNKIILDTYGETITLKRRRDGDADKDEEPSVGPDRGSKRRKEGKEPELAKEPMQTTFQMEEPSHLEFDTGAKDQPFVESSQHPEWFSQQHKPPTLDRDWNKTLSATHGSIQPWISELVKQSDSRSSFNELMDIPLDFSHFLMNRLKVGTLTPELIVGPTYELLKGSYKSLVKLEYHLEEVYKAITDQLDWVNPKEDLVPRTMWIQEPIDYNKHTLWGVSHWGRKCQQFYGFTVNHESACDVYSKRRIIVVTELKIVEWHNYKHLD
nr:hypothetical protein [Tanacetum cinerariifolium]